MLWQAEECFGAIVFNTTDQYSAFGDSEQILHRVSCLGNPSVDPKLHLVSAELI